MREGSERAGGGRWLLTGVVPLDGVDGVAGSGGVGEDAGVAGLHRDVEELHRVAAARGEQRRRRIHEPHRIRAPSWTGDGGGLRISLGFGPVAGSRGGLALVGAAAPEEEEEEI